MLFEAVVLNPLPAIVIAVEGDAIAGLTEVIFGTDVTVIVNVLVGPTQLLAVGVTVNTPEEADVPVLVAVNDAIEPPDPLTPIPIVVLLFAHV
jgi:hypothetical protein